MQSAGGGGASDNGLNQAHTRRHSQWEGEDVHRHRSTEVDRQTQSARSRSGGGETERGEGMRVTQRTKTSSRGSAAEVAR